MKLTTNLCHRGFLYVRTVGRAVSCRRIHWLPGIFLSFCLIPSAGAVPPLVPATNIAQTNLQAWWKPGDLVVGVEGSPGQTAMRPLINVTPMVLPTNLNTYEKLGIDCQETVHASGTFGGHPIEGIVSGDPMNPRIQVTLKGRLIAENVLGRPANICEMRLVEADDVPGLELIVAWKIETETMPIQGFTVYRIPEALDPSPRGQPQ